MLDNFQDFHYSMPVIQFRCHEGPLGLITGATCEGLSGTLHVGYCKKLTENNVAPIPGFLTQSGRYTLFSDGQFSMDIGVPIRDLGSVDSKALSDEILALDESAWRAEEVRQKKYEDVHYNTESVILIFCDHDNWPDIDLIKGAGWERLAPLALPLMHNIIGNFYPSGGTILRAMAAKLKAGKTITPHTDSHISFHRGHRIHVPVTTNNKVRFMIEGRPHKLEPGKAYEINNQKRHSVINTGQEDRVTFIFDYVPGAQQ